jgi:LPS export ABC transporter permease LptG
MKAFGVVDRLTIREVMAPAFLGFVTYTFLVVMRGLFNLIEQVLVRGVAAADAARVLLMTVPHIVVLTIPMSFLFGVLLAVGRMNSDNELVALQAGGIAPRRLLRPILIMGLLLTGLNASLYLEVIPKSTRELRDLKIRLFANARNLGRIEPKVFYEELPNVLVYLRDADADTGVWKDIIVFDSTEPGEERLTLARRGRMLTSEESQQNVDPRATSGAMPEVQQWIRLEDVVTYQFPRKDPETFRINRMQTQLFRPIIRESGTVRYRRGVAERDTSELVSFLRGGQLSTPEGVSPLTPDELRRQRRNAAIELNMRIAIPFACVVFALLALPLGVGARSGGKGRGFVVSVGVVLIYYVISNYGQMLASEGRLPPWLGIWAPNLLLMTISLFLMSRMSRWMGERESRENPLARLVAGIKGWRTERRTRAYRGHPVRPATGSVPLNIQRRRYGTRFPTLFDRYLVRRLLPPLIMVVGSTALLYVVADLTQNAEEIARNQVSMRIVLAYYANLVPQVFLDVTPFALMIAVLILLTLLERRQELTALKAAGISLFRLAVPVLLVAAAVASGLWVLGESVVPEANRETLRLLDIIKGRETTRSYRASDRQWLLSRDGESFYNFLRYDSPTQTLIRFSLFKIDQKMNLKFYLFTHRIHFEDGAWVADSGWFRQIFPDGTDEFKRITSPMKLEIPEGPEYFSQEYRRPSEMNVRELREYIKELVESGYRPASLIVRWHQKFAYPLSAFIMVLLALPFGLNRGGRKVSTMQGIAIALGLGIAYFMLVALFGKLGEVDVLPPVVGAWAPLVLAFFFAVNRLTTLRT